MHHYRVAGHQLVGTGGAAGEHIDAIQIEAAQGFGSQAGIGVRESAAGRVDGVMATANAVIAQHDAPGTRGLAADHAEHLFDVVVGYRCVGQKGRGAGDVGTTATGHIFLD